MGWILKLCNVVFKNNKVLEDFRITIKWKGCSFSMVKKNEGISVYRMIFFIEEYHAACGPCGTISLRVQND